MSTPIMPSMLHPMTKFLNYYQYEVYLHDTLILLFVSQNADAEDFDEKEVAESATKLARLVIEQRRKNIDENTGLLKA